MRIMRKNEMGYAYYLLEMNEEEFLLYTSGEGKSIVCHKCGGLIWIEHNMSEPFWYCETDKRFFCRDCRMKDVLCSWDKKAKNLLKPKDLDVFEHVHHKISRIVTKK